MKKFICLFICLFFIISSCNKDDVEIEKYNIEEYNHELLTLSETSNESVYKKEEVWDSIMKIYIPNNDLFWLSRGIDIDMIQSVLRFCNVEKTSFGFNLFISMDEDVFVIMTDYYGRVLHMFFYPKKLYKSYKFLFVEKNMSLSEFENIFPTYILYEKCAWILNSDMPDEIPYVEIVFDDGNIGVIQFKKQNGEYVVDNKFFSASEIDDKYLSTL